ncbi:MAG: PAS domain S-box protein [Spirochaetales bacterium]|nr:PAS domain S-box protein [Spirochaetales bacterium]
MPEKQIDRDFEKIKWLLKSKKVKSEFKSQDYGDLTTLNRDRTIMDSVGKTVLNGIVSDYLNLLETSAAIYEKNGDYAIGIFSSDWCRFMDCASRALCKSSDNKKALESGKWLCHESCWADASRKSMETKRPVDIECSGGLNIYAIPIKANNEVIGSINFSYGNPPTDDVRLTEIAEQYKVSLAELKNLAQSYETRPPFIIDIAKEKLEYSGRLIGEIVERTMAEQALRESEERFHSLFKNINVGVALHEIVLNDKGEPIDFVYLDVNPLYEEITTLKKDAIIGKRGLEVIPNLEQKWIDLYGKVALTGESVSVTDHSDFLDKYWDVKAYSPAKNQFAVVLVDITDKIKAEKNIIKAKEIAERYLDMAGSIFVSLDRNGDIILVNQKGLEILEYEDSRELIGKNWFETVIPPDIISKVRRVFSRVMAGDLKGVERYENEVITKSGKRKTISWYNSYLQDDSGKIEHLLSSGIDNTEISKVNSELSRSEERFDLAMKASKDGIFDWNLITNEIYYSPGWKSMLGYDYDEIPNDFSIWESNTAPEDVKKSWTMQQEVINKQRDRFEMEFKMKHKDGHWVDILSRAECIFDDDETPLRMVGTHVDISERKLAEEEIAKTKSYLQNTIDGLIESVVLLDEQGYILLTNQAWQNFAKKNGALTASISVGANYFAASKSENNEWHKEAKPFAEGLKKLRSGELKSFNFEYPCHSPDKERWFSCTVTLFEGVDSKYYVITHKDITEFNRALEENENTKSQLQQAQKMEAIGTLAGGIAHDFNNILAVIMGYTSLAIDNTNPGSQLHEVLNEVLTATDRAKELVKQILSYSRQNKVERAHLKLQPLVKEAMKMLRSSIPTTISISENIRPNSGSILADPTQIQQIVINLCTNAYHAMEETGGTLSVSLNTVKLQAGDPALLIELTPGEYFELTVSDTGEGISPNMIDKIFDPYFTTKDIGKGTGMGLAITHGIVKEYGGSITVESQLGKGSTFHVFIPLVPEFTEPVHKINEVIPRGKERVLFVDDEENIAQMAQKILENFGYHVTVRCNSLEALSTFKKRPDYFDIVITDQTMPQMTGSTLAAEMMQIRPDIPIILLSGYSNLIDENSAKEMGIKEFMFKPFSQKKLANLIRKVLDGEE